MDAQRYPRTCLVWIEGPDLAMTRQPHDMKTALSSVLHLPRRKITLLTGADGGASAQKRPVVRGNEVLWRVLQTFPHCSEMGSCCILQAGLEHLGSRDPLTSVSQVAGPVGMYHMWLFD